ncbi:MAG: DUF402 domain-containing protein [Roseiflexaceae bacterium]|nr:DUF402 domain-containing protein [Roseiflexaceae bacterium]
MCMINVQLLKPAKGQVITFDALLLHATATSRVVRAEWQRPPLDLGYVVFETGDTFVEHYYSDAWYTIYAIYRSALPPWVEPANLKGWYCNVARPAVFGEASIISEDLEIDLFVSPDRQTLLTLDMDEFEARGFVRNDPATYQAALAALAELKRMASAGDGAFAQPQYDYHASTKMHIP